MPYISPIQILKDSKLSIEIKLDRESLRIARQALLAEIELSKKQVVKLGGKELSKDDVLKLFDNLQSDGAMVWHEAIHEDSFLLNFLAYQHLDPKEWLEDNTIYQNREFQAFIAPYFGEAYAEVFKQILKKPDFDTLRSLNSFPEDWWTPQARRVADQNIFESIRGRIRLILQNIEKVKKSWGSGGIRLDRDLYHPNLVDALNALPEHFRPIRNEYGLQLVYLAYAAWNKKQKMEADYIIKRVEQIEGGTALTHQISYYWEQSDRLETYSEQKAEGSASCLVYLGLLIFLFFLRLGCNTNRSHNYEYPTYRYPQVESPVWPTTSPYGESNRSTLHNEALQKLLEDMERNGTLGNDSTTIKLRRLLQQSKELNERLEKQKGKRSKFVPPTVKKDDNIREQELPAVEIIEEKQNH